MAVPSLWPWLRRWPGGLSTHARQVRHRPFPNHVLMLETLEDRTAPAVYEVPGAYSLHEAIADAELSTDINNVIVLAPGNYSVASELIAALPDNSANPPRLRSITILGSGAVLDAQGAGRVFELDGNVTLTNLTIQGGLVQGPAGADQAEGGGLLIDDGSTVTLNDVVVENNVVRGASGTQAAGQPACGGGIYVSGATTATTLTMINCTIADNQAVGGNGDVGPDAAGTGANQNEVGFDGGAAAGGGLYVFSAKVVLESCNIEGNQALGGSGGQGGIYMSSDFGPEGQVGGTGGSASGGGLYESGTVALLGADIGSNIAQGGTGGNGTFAGGTGARGGIAEGGGCFADEVGEYSVVDSTSHGNTAQFQSPRRWGGVANASWIQPLMATPRRAAPGARPPTEKTRMLPTLPTGFSVHSRMAADSGAAGVPRAAASSLAGNSSFTTSQAPATGRSAATAKTEATADRRPPTPTPMATTTAAGVVTEEAAVRAAMLPAAVWPATATTLSSAAPLPAIS